LRYGPLALCGGFLVWHSLQFNFVTDDAFISFVFSRNLAEHGELTFNLGDPVEGYTNFLWTVLLGVLMALGLPPEITSLVLGTGFGLGTLVVVFFLMAHLGDGDSAWDPLPAALLALSAGFACWSSGGLETQMFTFFVTFGLYAYVRGDRDGRWLSRAGWLLALAAMTRPEGLLCAAVVGAHRLTWNLVRDRRLLPSRDEWLCAAWFLGVWGPTLVWRWLYYGYPFPNTYYVKAAGETTADYRAKLLGNGLYYVWQWASQTRIVYAAPLALAGALVAARKSSRLYFGTLAVSLAAIYLTYVVSVGGDFMGLHRFIMPVFVLAAVTLALGVRLLCARIGDRVVRRDVALVGVAWLLGCFGALQRQLGRESMRWGNWQSDHGIDTPAFLWVYTHDRAVIGRAMRPCMRATDFSILGGAGAKPYYGRMRGVDVFGLVSEAIAHEIQPTHPRPGHNKWAPDSFLLAYQPRPTFIFSCYSIHRDPARPSFNCAPSFWTRNGYRQVTLHVPGLLQQGEYYSFFVAEDRDFSCPGLVR
jgi:hypothetical protein